jgi:hypothetical protein
MKKIVSTFALALLVGGLTFAEDPAVKIGAWGRGIFVPVATGGQVAGESETQTLLGVSWGGEVRTGITISGTSEFVGFQVDMNADKGAGTDNEVSLGDQQKIWVKPFTGVTVQVGEAYDDTLRGNSAFGSWDWIRLGSINGEDDIFTRVDTKNGFEVSYGADAFYGFAAFRGLTPAGAVSTNDVAIKQLQYGAGYTIKDIGLLRAQVLGSAAAGLFDAYNTIEAAFRLTAVQNLYVDAGIKYPTDADAAGYANSVSVYGNYTADAAKIHVGVQYVSPNDTGETLMTVAGGLDYSLGDGLGFGADVRYNSKKAAYGDPADRADSLITVFAGVTKGFSNGLIGVGVQYATTGVVNGAGTSSVGNLGVASDDGAAQFYLPVKVEFWF